MITVEEIGRAYSLINQCYWAGIITTDDAQTLGDAVYQTSQQLLETYNPLNVDMHGNLLSR